MSFQRWEYKVEEMYLRPEDITKLGNEGWEMCGVRTRLNGEMVFYFKRPTDQIPGRR